MKILRIFPRRTSYTPTDAMVIINEPPSLFVPEHDEVHISCTFTWDKPRAEWLRYQWEAATDKPVKLGGPAYDTSCNDFTPGLYVRQGITFTSRGCNNNCPWCFVPKREGKLKELPICAGNVIQDNNFLQCSQAHKDKVFEMLKTQRQISFRGGLEADLLDSHFIKNVRGLKIETLWLACDTASALRSTCEAIAKLKRAGFSRSKIRVYVLIGKDMAEEENRLTEIYKFGAMPFAQLFRDVDGKIKYDTNWKRFACQWSRPAATRAHVEKGTNSLTRVKTK